MADGSARTPGPPTYPFIRCIRVCKFLETNSCYDKQSNKDEHKPNGLNQIHTTSLHLINMFAPTELHLIRSNCSICSTRKKFIFQKPSYFNRIINHWNSYLCKIFFIHSNPKSMMTYSRPFNHTFRINWFVVNATNMCLYQCSLQSIALTNQSFSTYSIYKTINAFKDCSQR